MFEWLNETPVLPLCKIDEEVFIQGYNDKTKMFKIEDEQGNPKGEIDLFDSKLEFNIDCFKDWKQKLYNKLKSDRNVIVQIYSTESGDNWFLEIHRQKFTVTDEIELLNYTIVFCGEVLGDVLTFQNSEQEDEDKFSNWIEEQIEKVSEFNNTDYWNTAVTAIVISDCLCDKKEYEILSDMFYEKYM